MPRNRMIKHQAFRSRHLAQVPIEVRWTFCGLWTLADDAGRLEDDPEAICADLYLRDRDVTPEVIEHQLTLLAEAGLICRYKVNGRVFLHMPTWERNQTISHRAPPRCPVCPADHTTDEDALFPSGDYETPGALQEPSGSPPERKGKGMGKGINARAREDAQSLCDRAESVIRTTTNTVARSIELGVAFEEFYEKYPRHVAPAAARKAWDRAVKTADPPAIIAGAERYAEQCQASRTEKRFIAHPASWLNAGRWADEEEETGQTEIEPNW